MMGSDFSDFLRQVPAGMIACLCMSGMLLLFSLSYIVFVRTRRSKSPSAPAAEPFKNDSFVSDPPSTPAYDTGELPDLDVLLNLPAAPPPPPVAPSRPVKPGTFGVKLADTGESIQAAEVMVIMRDMDEGRLIIQIGDQTYSNLSSFPDTKNRFLKVMKELAGIVTPRPGSTPPASETPSETPIASESGEPAKTDTPGGLLSRLAENKEEASPTMGELLSTPSESKKVAPSVTPPPPLPDGSMPGDLPKFQLGELPLAPRRGPGFLRMNKDQERELKKPVPEINIAQAIQEYLQYKLRHTPEYAGRSINVSQASHGGVRIEVDGTYYEAVGDVEDQEIRAFLAATIEEWQSRQ